MRSSCAEYTGCDIVSCIAYIITAVYGTGINHRNQVLQCHWQKQLRAIPPSIRRCRRSAISQNKIGSTDVKVAYVCFTQPGEYKLGRRSPNVPNHYVHDNTMDSIHHHSQAPLTYVQPTYVYNHVFLCLPILLCRPSSNIVFNLTTGSSPHNF